MAPVKPVRRDTLSFTVVWDGRSAETEIDAFEVC